MYIMKKVTRPLIIGNWKMNPQTISSASRLAKELKSALAKFRDTEIVIAPPAPFLEHVSRARNHSSVFQLGSQNVHDEKMGPHTGEVSLAMLEEFDVTYVIVGHSERRSEGETEMQINKKLRATIKAGLVPVLCVGERERDLGAEYLSFIEQQIRTALSNVTRAMLARVVVAYEPVWAIGTGKNATADDAHEMKLFIERVLSDMYSRKDAQKVRILYGGSVNEKNARDLFMQGKVDGFLVGGASLSADAFVGIVSEVHAS